PAEATQGVLGGAFGALPFVSDPATPTATETDPIPASFTLHQNYPNPFNPQTTISYTLARSERVALRVYDVRGRLVQTLVDGTQPAGTHAIPFDGGHLPSGTYFYRLDAGPESRTRQMVLVR
ncbi:MAG: T9SS type A sorting domain-containing protein, partial [Rhodothermales bacterium]|nr:T9SS type A sorting domain-containing protein [Rhodothermales bacterium]